MITHDFKIATNEDWVATIGLSDALDLTGAIALMQVKPSADHPDDLLDLSSEADANEAGITFSLNTGDKTIGVIVPQSLVAEFHPGGYVYDVLVIYAGGQRRREASGSVYVMLGITSAVRANPTYVLDAGGADLETE